MVPSRDDAPPADRADGPRVLHDGTPVTLVHVVRHGEVHNPERVLYARLPGYHLSDLGASMSAATADHLADRDITAVTSSPLERAQETAAPIAAAHDLPVGVDERLIESASAFEGLTIDRRILSRPRHWGSFINPIRPSWGEPYRVIEERMRLALEDAQVRSEGHEGVLVSHQLPIWTLRRSLGEQRLWHHPRRRQCTLASVTTVLFHGTLPVRVMYAEPAAHLLAGALDVTGASNQVLV